MAKVQIHYLSLCIVLFWRHFLSRKKNFASLWFDKMHN